MAAPGSPAAGPRAVAWIALSYSPPSTPGAPPCPSDPDALVSARGLTKRFGEFVAVDGVEFDIDRGRVVRVPRAQRGRQDLDHANDLVHVPVLGRDAAGARAWTRPPTGPRIRARIGLVPQEDTLDLELTVLDNLMIYGRYFDLARKVIRQRAERLLEFAQLTERAHDRVESLSGGMKRRLTIARSLISDPELLILDEPTTGLDPQARHLLWDRLYRLKQEGVTLVITTHYMDEAEQLCDRLVVMDHGRFAAEGIPGQLIEQLLDQGGRRAAVPLRRARGPLAVDLAGLAERVEVLPDRLLLYTDDGDASLAEVHRRGLRPESALVRRSTLEDVFLRLTGRTLVE